MPTFSRVIDAANARRVKRFRQTLRRRMLAEGFTNEQADRKVGEIGDGTILQWLWDQREDIIKFILSLVLLFAAQEEPKGVPDPDLLLDDAD